jgi:hypothetical protein
MYFAWEIRNAYKYPTAKTEERTVSCHGSPVLRTAMQNLRQDSLALAKKEAGDEYNNK